MMLKCRRRFARCAADRSPITCESSEQNVEVSRGCQRCFTDTDHSSCTDAARVRLEMKLRLLPAFVKDL